MKFSAQYYLTKHLKETHTDTASTCNICQKSFSGRRYLTMHIKASHESGSSGVSESTRCKECDRGFASARDKSYHASKVHGAPKPEGVFEDCSLCDKFFKTKGELNQHIARIHQVTSHKYPTFVSYLSGEKGVLERKPRKCSSRVCEGRGHLNFYILFIIGSIHMIIRCI